MVDDRVIDILNGCINQMRELTKIVERLNNISVLQQHQINMLRFKVNCLQTRVNNLEGGDDPDEETTGN